MDKIGEVEGREVWVRLTGEGQEILFEDAGRCGILAMVLAGGDGLRGIEEHGGREFVVVEHTRGVDRFLVELIDLLITFRYCHPTMVQLPLVMTEGEAAELLEVMQGALPGGDGG